MLVPELHRLQQHHALPADGVDIKHAASNSSNHHHKP